MQKQIIGFFAFIIASAEIIPTSTAHAVDTGDSMYLVLNDTTPYGY